MITIRNRDIALSVSCRAGAANLVPGMLVSFVPGAAVGEQPNVVKASAGDMADATKFLGIVDYIQPDSQDVDFTVDPALQVLTPIAKTIPLNAQVNVWLAEVVIAYHQSLLPAGLQATAVREATLVGFDATTNFPALVAGSEVTNGMVYRVDGPEITIIYRL